MSKFNKQDLVLYQGKAYIVINMKEWRGNKYILKRFKRPFGADAALHNIKEEELTLIKPKLSLEEITGFKKGDILYATKEDGINNGNLLKDLQKVEFLNFRYNSIYSGHIWLKVKANDKFYYVKAHTFCKNKGDNYEIY